MAERIALPPTIASPEDIPEGIEMSEQDYLNTYAVQFYEYAEGRAIKMSPIHMRHNRLTDFLLDVFRVFFLYRPIGTVEHAPFTMRLPEIGHYREPDLMIILNTNPGSLTPTMMIGPADICIEVVSPESIERDHGTKFEEYERAGVGEYWIIDPVHQEGRFYRQAQRPDPSEPRRYEPVAPDAEGNFYTPLLPDLVLHVPSLWIDPLPNLLEVTAMVKAMVSER